MKRITIKIIDTFRNKMMKANKMKLQTAMLLVLTLIIFSSCEDFLTENLKGSFSTDTFYKNEKQAIQAINGV